MVPLPIGFADREDWFKRLASGRSHRMDPARNSQAGGFVLAACIIGGTVAGAILHQPSIGFLIGLGAGILLALLIWVVDRSR
jgi:hypothetical protein